MIVPRFIAVGVKSLSLRWKLKTLVLPKEVDVTTRNHAEQLLALIRANASGRPGPNVITGAYRESWRITPQGHATYVVSTDAPQAARLELGFVGEDALGRIYNQPPFPHVRPAADKVEDAYVKDMFVVVGRGL